MAKEEKEVKKVSNKKTEQKEKKNVVERIEDIKDNLEDKVEVIKDKLEDMGDDIEDKFDDVKEKVEDKLEDVKEDADEQIDKLSIKLKKLPKWARLSVFIVPAVLLVLLILTIGTFIDRPAETTITESSLKSIEPSSKITTVEFTQKATATKYSDFLKMELYHVSYEGKIKAGFDFEEVEFNVNEKDKIVTITIPEITIETVVNTDNKTLDFMFIQESAKTDNVFAEAFALAKKDLKKRAKEDKNIKKRAKENAIAALEGFYKDWIESIDSDYQVVIK